MSYTFTPHTSPQWESLKYNSKAAEWNDCWSTKVHIKKLDRNVVIFKASFTVQQETTCNLNL